jgi:hypothetical protein
VKEGWRVVCLVVVVFHFVTFLLETGLICKGRERRNVLCEKEKKRVLVWSARLSVPCVHSALYNMSRVPAWKVEREVI